MFDVLLSNQSYFVVKLFHLYTYLLKNFNIPKNSWIFCFLLVVGVFDLHHFVISKAL